MGAMKKAILLVCLSALLLAVGSRENSVPTNLVLIVVDTLRLDEARNPDIAPNLTTLAGQATVYAQAYSNCPWTKPSMAAMFTGVYPSVHRAVKANARKADIKGNYLNPELQTLTEYLKQAGFHTAAMQANPFLNRSMHMDQGFDTYTYLPRNPADVVTDRAIAWLKDKATAPFFLYVHYMDPHMPYYKHTGMPAGFYPPDQARITRKMNRNQVLKLQLTQKEKALLKRLYQGEVLFADQHIGRLLKYIEKLPANTLVALTADHGEEFWEHGGFEHGHSQYNELLRVPLLLHTSGQTQALRVDHPFDLLRLPDLLLSSLGLVSPALYARAHTKAQAPVFSESILYGKELKTIMKDQWKLVYTPYDQTVRLYDLTRDPGEQQDVSDQHPDKVSQLTAALRQLMEQNEKLSKQYKAEKAEPMDAEQLEHLRSLGYIE